MLKIYHNPRCSKSREGLEMLKNSDKEFEIIPYLKNGLSIGELTDIIKMLNIQPIALVRKNEAVWKNNYKDTAMTDEEIITAMHEHPKLMERPIVLSRNKALIGRPPAVIKDFL